MPTTTFKDEKWKRYVGLAASAIVKKNELVLHVICPEITPFLDGEVKPTEDEAKIKVNNAATNQIVERKIHAKNTIECEYLGKTNSDVPDIHIGEQVYVFNYLGSDTFYWCPTGRDDNLRMTEHVKIICANKPKQDGVVDDEHSYYIEVDTRYVRGIRLHTGTTMEEAFGYDINMDPDLHSVTIADTDGTSIVLFSDEKQVIAQNDVGSSINMKQQDITSTCVGTNTVNANAVIINASTATINAVTTINGATTINGTTTINDATTIAGATGITGGLTADQIQTPKINPDSHGHG